MPRKKKAAGGGTKPGELPVTYADMVTLLLTFFVFLMSMANFDTQVLKDFFQAFGGAFGRGGASGAGVLIGGAAFTSETANLSAGNSTQDSQANSMVNLRSGADTPGRGGGTSDSQNKGIGVGVPMETREQFEEVSLELGGAEGIKAEVTAQGLKITLEEQFAQFQSGSATLPPEAVPKLQNLIRDNLQQFIDDGFEIMVTGHTDNVPLGPATRARYVDNRGLATERANNVLRVFEGMGVPPTQISAAGYGPYRPVADNSTEEGRAKNRRIEILVKYKQFSVQ